MVKPQTKKFKICHKHLATKTHNNKRKKISQTRLVTKLPKKKIAKPKKKYKKLAKKLENRKNEKILAKKELANIKKTKTGNGKSKKNWQNCNKKKRQKSSGPNSQLPQVNRNVALY